MRTNEDDETMKKKKKNRRRCRQRISNFSVSESFDERDRSRASGIPRIFRGETKTHDDVLKESEGRLDRSRISAVRLRTNQETEFHRRRKSTSRKWYRSSENLRKCTKYIANFDDRKCARMDSAELKKVR